MQLNLNSLYGGDRGVFNKVSTTELIVKFL